MAVLLGTASWAEADAMALLEARGCVIGPNTQAELVEEGLSEDAIEHFLTDALAHPDTKPLGDWHLLPSEICKIQLPEIESEFTIGSPQIRAHISEIDAYEQTDGLGCFFDPEGFEDALVTRGTHSREEAFSARIHFLASSIVAGEITFFMPNPLWTPVSFQDITGVCANIEEIDQIRRSQELWKTNFDYLIRTGWFDEICDTTPAVGNVAVMRAFAELTANETGLNRFAEFEIFLIALAAGWVEGWSLNERGTSRPPFCGMMPD